MKKSVLIVAVLGALVLAGCAQREHHRMRIDPARPQVLVAPGGYIVVNQEPVILRRSEGKDTITWQLPSGSNIRFAPNGITVDAFVKPLSKDMKSQQRTGAAVRDTSQVAGFKCSPNEARTEFSCMVARDVRSGFYAYTIRLLDDGKPLELDPTVMVE